MTKRKAHKLPKVLARRDVEKILNSFSLKCPSGIRNRVMTQVLYKCGLRNEEVRNLAPADVDLEKGFVFVQEGKNLRDRYVPLDSETLEWCKKWAQIRPDSKWFFCTLSKHSTGKQLQGRYLRQVLENAAIKTNVYIQNGRKKKAPHPHTLRHCFATELIEDGFNIREVQELLGHKSIQTTSTYLSVRPEHLAAKIRQRGKVACQ